MADGTFLSRPALAASQLAQLRRLLSALVPANLFYTQKLKAAGIGPEIESLKDFTARFPFTTKQELVGDQKEHPPYGSNLTFPPERYTRYHQTSGTSGAPLRWLDTPESWDWMVRNWAEVFRAAGVQSGDRVFFAFGFGPFIGFWLAFEAASQIGCLCLPGGGLSSTGRLRVILDNGATVLCCTPTYALRLAEVAAEEKIDLTKARVRTLIVAGEPGGSIPATRARLAQLWPGACVFDHHGMTETGPVSYECPAHPGVLHVMESAFIAEIIDPATAKPVEPGTIGELVLTNLGRTGSPLLRYRTGDLVKAALPRSQPATPAGRSGTGSLNPRLCACGRSDLALEGGILGRCDDMVVVRGVNIFPSAVEDIIGAGGGVAEYQVLVTAQGSLAEMSVCIEPAAGCLDTAALSRRLEKAFEIAFALRVPVTVVPPGSLPRFEMKARRWVKSQS
ncbi:MAG: AMP-binding protein [Verrucomicrobiota bacterium]